jgi:hypothetical protein
MFGRHSGSPAPRSLLRAGGAHAFEFRYGQANIKQLQTALASSVPRRQYTKSRKVTCGTCPSPCLACVDHAAVVDHRHQTFAKKVGRRSPRDECTSPSNGRAPFASKVRARNRLPLTRPIAGSASPAGRALRPGHWVLGQEARETNGACVCREWAMKQLGSKSKSAQAIGMR